MMKEKSRKAQRTCKMKAWPCLEGQRIPEEAVHVMLLADVWALTDEGRPGRTF
jgi:hypothetical protein